MEEQLLTKTGEFTENAPTIAQNTPKTAQSAPLITQSIPQANKSIPQAVQGTVQVAQCELTASKSTVQTAQSELTVSKSVAQTAQSKLTASKSAAQTAQSDLTTDESVPQAPGKQAFVEAKDHISTLFSTDAENAQISLPWTTKSNKISEAQPSQANGDTAPSEGAAQPKSRAAEGANSQLVTTNTVVEIPINKIASNPNQPRKDFSEAAIIKLADSIRQFGIIQPLTVRKSGHLYELIAGERRLRAAKELCWSSVPCIITEVTEEKSAQISIIENLIRENLNIFEQAIAIQSLIDTYCLTQEQIAEKLSTSQSYIANKLRLLRFSQIEREKILKNSLSERHARALLRINDQSLRDKAIDTIVNNELNVSETEEMVQSMLYNREECTKKPQKDPKAYKDIPSFYNAVNRAIDCAKTGNLNIKCRKIVGEAFTELTIIIPNMRQDT